MNSITNKVTSGFMWTSFDKFSSQFVQFIIGIIIARFVSPHEYGVLGILMIFIILSQVFIDSGFGSALIYRNDKNDKDLQTAFSFNLGISLLLFAILYVLAPHIESFYDLPQLALYLRISIIVLFINALLVVPTAILRIDFQFKTLAIGNIISTLLSGFAGVILAFWGFGVWALIIQLLSRPFVLLLCVCPFCKWLPRFRFYKSSFYNLLNYGVKIFSASFLTKIVDECTAFFVGKILTSTSLGVFTRSNQFAGLPSTSMVTIIGSVIFPSLSSIKNDEEQFDALFKKSVLYISAFSIPLFLWIAMISDPLVRILLTDKWIAVVPVMQILCIGRCFYPVANVSEQVMNAKGRSDLFLKQQIIKMTIKAIAVICLIRYGLIAVAIADAIYTSTQYLVTCIFLRKISHYGFISQIKTMWPFIIASIISAIVGFVMLGLTNNPYLQIIYSVFAAIFVYYVLVNLLQKEFNIKQLYSFIKK